MDINNLTIKLKNVALYALFNEEKKVIDITNVLLIEMINNMPSIMQLYLKSEMIDYREDMNYWPQQFEKVYALLDNFDRFALFDALYFELRSNLLLLLSVCEEKGIIIE